MKNDNHEAAPKAWRDTRIITGDYDFDASVAHCKNKSAPAKIAMHISGDTYRPVTGYRGYSGYSGDN